MSEVRRNRLNMDQDNDTRLAELLDHLEKFSHKYLEKEANIKDSLITEFGSLINIHTANSKHCPKI